MDYPITEFDASPDKADNTDAIQNAIETCATAGGGRVVIPAGVFVAGSIVLHDNITLHLSAGAVLRGSTDLDRYPFYEAAEPNRMGKPWRAFIYARNAENIAVQGEGTLSPNGAADVFQLGKGNTPQRPYGIHFESCRNITVAGIRMENSAFWMHRYFCCDDVRLTGLHIYNHSNLNNDGSDIDGCHRVTVCDCVIDSSDDALCIKSEGLRNSEDIAVTNCILSSHASAIKLGTGSAGGFKRVRINNCVIRPSRAPEIHQPFQTPGGLAGIDLGQVDGGIMEDIDISDITIDGAQTPIFIRFNQRNSRWDGAPEPTSSAARRISLSNIRAINAGPITSSIAGYPGHPIEDITLRNIDLDISYSAFEGRREPLADFDWQSPTLYGSADPAHRDAILSLDVDECETGYPVNRMYNNCLPAYGLYLRHVAGLRLDSVRLRSVDKEQRPAIVADDVSGNCRNIEADTPGNQNIFRIAHSPNLHTARYSP